MIIANNVTKYYGPHAAVQNLSFKVDSGEVIGLLGLNGAGKTTTLRMLSGLVMPTAGDIVIDGLTMAEHPEAVRARLGFLPETPPLYGEMSVEGFLFFVARIKGLRKDVPAAVSEAMSATDLQDVRKEPIFTLSHGFKRRVGIAQAIVHKPALILLDEPTSGLDPVQVVHMRQLIRNLQRRHTVLVSSHILAEIHAVCDRLFVLHEGRIAAQGTEAELANRLSGSVSLRLEVRSSTAGLEKALAGFDALTQLTIEGNNDGIVTARLELERDEREALTARLVQAGIGVREVQWMRLELENIFLKLTGDSQGRAASATAQNSTPKSSKGAA